MAKLNLTILLSVAMLLLMSLTPAIIYAPSIAELNEENEPMYPPGGDEDDDGDGVVNNDDLC